MNFSPWLTRISPRKCWITNISFRDTLQWEVDRFRWIATIYAIHQGGSCHFETVVLLSDKKVDGHINIDLDVEKLEGKSGSATYAEIKAYILEKYGFTVPSNYIAQIKDKAGLKKRRNYHIGSGQGRVLICPPEKEEAIMDAFRHFNLIWRIRSCSLRRAAFLFRAIGWCCLSLQDPVLCLAKHSKVQNRGFMIFCVNGANCIESFWGE